MSYESMARIAQQGGSLYFVVMFVAGLIYAVWPKNRDAFQRAKYIALDDGDDNV